MYTNNSTTLPASEHSHKLIEIECDFKQSPKCSKVYSRQYRDILKYRRNNNGKDICLFCSRMLKFSGRTNPNCIHPFDDFYFSSIDTKEKAYVLGLIAAEGSIRNNSITVEMQKSDASELLTAISTHLQLGPIHIRKIRDLCSFSINSKQAVSDVCSHLGLLGPGPKSSTIQFPLLGTKELQNAFILGFFDGDGGITFKSDVYNYPRCSISSNSVPFLTEILNLFPHGSLSASCECATLEYAGPNSVDFLVSLYSNKPLFYLNRKYELYKRACSWLPTLKNSGTTFDTFKCVKTDSLAVLPSKTNGSDSGYDLTIIKVHSVKGDVIFYDTGLKVQPPNGWWLALVPRSSISKTGYMLANSIGIIDRTYIGPVLVALRKIDATMPDLQLPCKIAQLVPMPAVHFEIEELQALENTSRGTGGFGSTTK